MLIYFYFTYFYLAIKSIYEARLRDYIYKFTTSRRSLFNLFYGISREERESLCAPLQQRYKKRAYYINNVPFRIIFYIQ